MDRRLLLQATALVPLVATFTEGIANASPIDPGETTVVQPDQIDFASWGNGPQCSAEMAKLYGDIDKPAPYLVLMRWFPGWFSAPHRYRTDRVCVVISGTWHVNSGTDFDPGDAVAVPAGGFVKRAAHTWHYDGVPADVSEPATIAVFGLGPVNLQLADPSKPQWRQV